jgi:hypothetical protein
VEKMKLWENGRRLRVKFLDGIGEVQNKVAAIAKEWELLANLTLDFVTSGASEIRISFADQGFSWSTVGTDALTVPSNGATMNYGWLEPATSLREYQRVVRHEFGHALGMIHEARSLGTSRKCTNTTHSRAGRRRTWTSISSRSIPKTAPTTPSSTRRRSWSTPSPTR